MTLFLKHFILEPHVDLTHILYALEAHLPTSVIWNKWDNEAQLGVLCLPQGCRERPVSQLDSTNFHSFIWTKEDGQSSWAHSLEFWNPSGGLSHAIVMITTRNDILKNMVLYFFLHVKNFEDRS